MNASAVVGDADLAAVGTLFAEPARARVLLALGDGRELPASMLAAEARVSASTVSEHLSKLLSGGLVTVTRRGRFRYYKLAGPQVSELIEVMSRIAPPAPVTSLREGTKASALRRARSCYNHLGGRLGVALTGADALRDLGARPPDNRAVRCCVDWTEQRHHMAGTVGSLLLDRFQRLDWIRPGRYNRALTVTDAGREELSARFGITPE
jgi:DNA-binding transcriptional ArsR family regulator